jgi:collagenase-like PrtC family protease
VKSIELLAPAKDLQAAVAAVDYGADALYIGGAASVRATRRAILRRRSPER